MASNSFGKIFRITTFGESHGSAIGVVVDGCPAGLFLSIEEINHQLLLRQPGKNCYTSARSEQDVAEILSGVFESVTTGAPIAILIRNKDADSSQYDSVKNLYRPGHANFTYLKKYGIFDYRGGGRSSGRETAARVAAGSIAKQFLFQSGIDCVAFISQIGHVAIQNKDFTNLQSLREKTYKSPVFCPDEESSKKIMRAIEAIKEEQDSLGGIVGCVATLPAGLGDPIYDKLEANLAFAMLSIPATKGFEIGAGFHAAEMKGSEHNDAFNLDKSGQIYTATNHAGGTLGGISTGLPLYFRVAFKPTSSIKKKQQTVTLQSEKTTFQLPETARHDPCIAIRAVPVVEAMACLVLADALLLNRCAKC